MKVSTFVGPPDVLALPATEDCDAVGVDADDRGVEVSLVAVLEEDELLLQPLIRVSEHSATSSADSCLAVRRYLFIVSPESSVQSANQPVRRAHTTTGAHGS
jgi:hypothetical protein